MTSREFEGEFIFSPLCAMSETLRLPAPALRDAGRLLHQQCWCWGCDIRRSAGNLLLAYGFERFRHAEGSSAYRYRSAEATILLWGVGLGWIPTAGIPIFIGRYSPIPAELPNPIALETISRPDELTLIRRPPDAPMWWSFIRALRWIGSYEYWILDRAGADWRLATVEAFGEKRVSRASAEAWTAHAATLEQALWSAVRSASHAGERCGPSRTVTARVRGSLAP